MLDVMVMRCVLSVFSMFFGSLGVFFLYLSFLLPALGGHALIFLGTATAIVWSTPQS